MIKLALALSVLLGLALGIASACSELAGVEADHRRAMNAIEERRAAWELAEEQRRAEEARETRGVADAVGDASRAVIAALVPAGILAAAILLVIEYRRRARFVWPRSDGLLPVPREQLATVGPAALAGYHQARIVAAQPVRNVTIKEVQPVTTRTSADRYTEAGGKEPAPTFAWLLEHEPDLTGAFILGYTNGAPLTGGWADLYSSAVAGLSGSGKTTTLRFLACQAALHGASFVVLDPHADAGEESLAGTLAPLKRRFFEPVAGTPRAMVHSLREVRKTLAVRLKMGWQQAAPLIIAVDEFTSLMGRSDVGPALAECLEEIAQEGRKVRVFALISGQIWTADRSGGTALRDALASAYVHRMRPEQARRLLPSADARRAAELRPGQALLARTSGEVIEVSIPKTTAEDVRRVAELLATRAATPGGYPQPSSRPIRAVAGPEIVAGEVAGYRHEVATEARARVAVHPDAARAATLFLDGKTMSEIVEEMRGVKSSQGARYQAALQEVQGLVRVGVEARLREVGQ